MSDQAVYDDADLKADFVQELLRQVRAQDTFGAWDRKSDSTLLEPFILGADKRAGIPICGDADPDTLTRIGQFYAAIGLLVEKRAGVMASPIMKFSHEGWGRVVVTAGRLVVINKHLRDVHRFGFSTVAKLNAEGEKLVADAIAWVEKHPDVANT